MTTRGPEIMEISRPTEEDPAARAARTAAAGAEAAAFLQQASRSSCSGGSSSFLWKKWKDLDWEQVLHKHFLGGRFLCVYFFFECCMFYVFMYHIFIPYLIATSEATRIAETSRDAARDAATAKSAGTMWCLGDEDLLKAIFHGLYHGKSPLNLS